MKIELNQSRVKSKWLVAFCFVALLVYAAYIVAAPNSLEVSREQLKLAEVKQGPLSIYAQAFGKLVSNNERLLTAPKGGTVSEILMRPGTVVDEDSVILRLTNPELEQQLQQAKGQLSQHQAELQALKYEQQNARLDFQGRIAEIEATSEQAELELSVHQELSQLGVSAGIELKRARLKLKQQNKRLKFEQQKYTQFVEMQRYQLTQAEIKLHQQQAQVQLLASQLEGMHIKAGMKGTIQTLDVTLGQSVQAGKALAKVGSIDSLVAKLRIPQRQADRVFINAKVQLDTGKGLLHGRISRVETLVNAGMVIAEAHIDSPLSDNARPELPVTAQILIVHDENIRYIKQYPGAKANSRQNVWVLASDNQLQQKTISFGDLTQDKLVISDGMDAGEQIVQAGDERFKNFDKISVIN